VASCNLPIMNVPKHGPTKLQRFLWLTAACLYSHSPDWPAPIQDQGRLALTIELADPQYDAIEFTLKDEDTNEWYAPCTT